MELIDTHCHLDYLEHITTQEALKNAQDRSISHIINVGTSSKNWEKGKQLHQLHPSFISYTVGIHPCYINDNWTIELKTLESFLIGDLKPVALGEIGLDYYHLPQDKAPEAIEHIKHAQQEAFKAQLTIAKTHDLPVIIHSRNAFKECIQIIENSGIDWKRVVFHCFSEGPVEVRQLNERGGIASFTGIITYKKADNVREAALTQGLDKLMLETDAPYLSPIPKRSKPNEPAFTRHIAEYCATLFRQPLEAIATKTTENAKFFFRL